MFLTVDKEEFCLQQLTVLKKRVKSMEQMLTPTTSFPVLTFLDILDNIPKFKDINLVYKSLMKEYALFVRSFLYITSSYQKTKCKRTCARE